MSSIGSARQDALPWSTVKNSSLLHSDCWKSILGAAHRRFAARRATANSSSQDSDGNKSYCHQYVSMPNTQSLPVPTVPAMQFRLVFKLLFPFHVTSLVSPGRSCFGSNQLERQPRGPPLVCFRSLIVGELTVVTSSWCFGWPAVSFRVVAPIVIETSQWSVLPVLPVLPILPILPIHPISECEPTPSKSIPTPTLILPCLIIFSISPLPLVNHSSSQSLRVLLPQQGRCPTNIIALSHTLWASSNISDPSPTIPTPIILTCTVSITNMAFKPGFNGLTTRRPHRYINCTQSIPLPSRSIDHLRLGSRNTFNPIQIHHAVPPVGVKSPSRECMNTFLSDASGVRSFELLIHTMSATLLEIES